MFRNMLWSKRHRGDLDSRLIADQHYNRQKPGTPQFVPPGRCLVLYRPGALWVTSWPFAEYVKHAWPGAWVCSCFRRESGPLASDLIKDAVSATRWFFGDPPDLGFITFVDSRRIRADGQPGYCYVKAGWQKAGFTKGGLHALQLLPENMPAPKQPIDILC